MTLRPRETGSGRDQLRELFAQLQREPRLSAGKTPALAMGIFERLQQELEEGASIVLDHPTNARIQTGCRTAPLITERGSVRSTVPDVRGLSD